MIEVDLNTDAIRVALAGAVAALSDMTPVMNEIGAHLRDRTEDRFKTGTGPDGTPWAPRSPVTIARYQRQGKTFGAKPLTLTGALSNAIFHRYGSDFAEVASNALQAAVMQFGAAQGQFGAFIGKDKLGRDHFHSIPWGYIPARPFIGISKEDETDVLDIISEALERAMQA